MKILILTNSVGGLYGFRKELLVRLVADQHQVYVSAPADEKIEALKKLGVCYLDTPIDRRGTNIIKDSRLFFHYLTIMRKICPDVVLSYTIKPNIYGGLLCRILNIAYIPNITGLGTALEQHGIMEKWIRILYKLSFANASCVFFQNNANANWMLRNKLIKGRHKVLPGSGVSLEEFHYLKYPDEDNAFSFLFMGRIMKEKGIEELLSAADRIKRKYPRTEFVLAGGCEEDYACQLKSLTEKRVIYYLGFQTDVKPLIKNCAAIIHPSYHEGMSNTLLEGAASGRPVLASNIPGCKEAFDEGITGLGFEPRSVESLEQTIEKFILLPHEAKEQMGIEARKKMEREFDRNIVINAYLEEIDKIRMGENRI